MIIRKGQRYSRREISAALGGSMQAYLPTKDGRIVAICLDPSSNPDAQREILVGEGPVVESTADMLVEQGSPLPLFLKRGDKEWEYIDSYKATGCSTDTVLLREKSLRAERPVTRVVSLVRVR